MSDLELENRLRADAARCDADEPELLDLDEALDLATHDEKHERTRRSALRWAAAAAAVVVVAGVAAALAWKSPSRDAAGSGAAKTLRVNGHTYVQHQVPAPGAAREPGAPAVVDVFVMSAAQDNPDARCNRLKPTVRLVAESATTVTVAASVYEVPTTGTYDCGFYGPLYRRIVLHLARPLGERRVVNASDGSTVGVVDPGAVPDPGYVPAGFVAGAVEHPDAADGMLDGIRDYARGRNQLTITERPDAEVGPPSSAPDLIVAVAGHRAEVRTADGRRCILWAVRPGISREVCSGGPTLLSEADLVKVARSLP